MHRVATWMGLLLLVPGAVCAQPAAMPSPVAPVIFPVELHGTWNHVPYDCASAAAEAAENDMRFELTHRSRNNFEDIEQAVAVRRVADDPATWHIVAASNVVGDEAGIPRLYVLGDRHLFVTDGSRMDAYVRCR